MTGWMLDTNTVSRLIRGDAAVTRRIQNIPISAIRISAVTEGELRFGLARRPEATRLHTLVADFLLHVDTLAWDRVVAASYGRLRADLERLGRPLGSLDLMIAAHSLAADTTLVSSDRAFRQVDGLRVEDWAA